MNMNDPKLKSPNLNTSKEVSIQKGDLFDYITDGPIINPINTLGVNGAGLALQFKKRFPDYDTRLRKLGNNEKLQLGQIKYDEVNNIISFPTKLHWKNPSKIEWIKQGLISLINFMNQTQTPVVYSPALGCGLGGLEFSKVNSIAQKLFKDTGLRIVFILR